MEVALLASWSIKKKLVLCVAMIAVIMSTLAVSGMISVLAYRDVVGTLSWRAAELPMAHDLTLSAEGLVAKFYHPRDDHWRGEISLKIIDVQQDLDVYKQQL